MSYAGCPGKIAQFCRHKIREPKYEGKYFIKIVRKLITLSLNSSEENEGWNDILGKSQIQWSVKSFKKY